MLIPNTVTYITTMGSIPRSLLILMLRKDLSRLDKQVLNSLSNKSRPRTNHSFTSDSWHTGNEGKEFYNLKFFTKISLRSYTYNFFNTNHLNYLLVPWEFLIICFTHILSPSSYFSPVPYSSHITLYLPTNQGQIVLLKYSWKFCLY